MTLRTFCGLFTLVGATFTVVACAADDESSFSVKCAPGDRSSCDCSDGTQGVQICNADGISLGACLCGPALPEGGAGSGGSGGTGATGGSGGATGSCTVYPDCNGCQGCFATCICQSSDVSGCQATCTDGGGSGGSAGSGGGGSCVASTCPPPSFAQAGKGCCTPAGNCGLQLTIISPTAPCEEKNQPGANDANCPSMSLMGFNLAGCCKTNHVCGLKDTFLGLGCVDPSAFGQPKGPSC